jgi:replicative DNA helicase
MEDRLRDTIPPHNLEAESATLGALLLDWSAMGDIVTFLHPDHFYSQQNQIIFNTLISLFGQGITGDVLTLTTELNKNGELEKAGGAGYIASLTDEVPSSANIDYYAHIVLDRATRRSLIKISTEIKSTAYDESRESRAILEEAEKKIFALTDMGQTIQIYDMHSVIQKTSDIIMKHYHNHGEFSGIPSGFSLLDSMTSGFQKSEMIIIGARPSMGKTALALCMMENIAVNQGIPCGFFSLEMSYEQIGQRLLSQVARIQGTKIRSGIMTMADLQKINDAAGRVYDAPLYICDTPNMQLLDLRAIARRMVQTKGVQIIFIDYIGLISTQNPNQQTFEQVAEISKSLKSLARELNIPIVALSQVSRDAEGNEPKLNQIRGSGAIEQDADVVMFIDRKREKQEDGNQMPVQDAKLIIAKQRNGPIGDVPLIFLNAFTRFENKAREE